MSERAHSDRPTLRRFGRECAAFLALQAALFVALQVPYARLYFRDHYFDAWADKHARLAALAPPRVILAGGSSWAFGVLSPRLEQALGRPVVNLGLHAGLGREFMLREAETAARPGDIVVLSLEYPLLAPAGAPDAPTVFDLLSRAPHAALFIGPRQVPRLLDEALHGVAKRPRGLARAAWNGAPPGNAVYARSAFNAQGDVVAHHAQGTAYGQQRHGSLPVPPEMLDATFERLEACARRVRDAGARLFVSLPPLPRDDRDRQLARLAGLRQRLATRRLEVLEPEVPGYARELFFDTAYHLTRRGARRRTDALVAALRPALARPPLY